MSIKTLLGLFVLSGFAYAQSPNSPGRRDSISSIFPPDLMPNARPNNSFYRYPMGNRMKATLDNMPVKVPDSSMHYSMLRSYQNYRKPQEPSRQFLPPMPRIMPKKN